MRPQASRRLDFIIIGLLVVAMGVFVVDRWILDEDDVATSAAADGDVTDAADPEKATASARNSIAVLPFVNMSADAEQQFLADGLTEELLNRLARISSLKVPARTSSFPTAPAPCARPL